MLIQLREKQLDNPEVKNSASSVSGKRDCCVYRVQPEEGARHTGAFFNLCKRGSDDWSSCQVMQHRLSVKSSVSSVPLKSP